MEKERVDKISFQRDGDTVWSASFVNSKDGTPFYRIDPPKCHDMSDVDFARFLAEESDDAQSDVIFGQANNILTAWSSLRATPQKTHGQDLALDGHQPLLTIWKTLQLQVESSIADRMKLHHLLITYSLFPSLDDVQLVRFVPVRLYIKEADETQSTEIETALTKLCEAFQFEIADEFPPELGSVFKRWLAKTKLPLSQTDLGSLWERGERALDLAFYESKEAKIIRVLADAVKDLLQSMDKPDMLCQVGRMLIIKETDDRGRVMILTRSLNRDEILYLEKHPSLFRTPKALLDALAEYRKEQGQDSIWKKKISLRPKAKLARLIDRE